jgi:hypothetical protein
MIDPDELHPIIKRLLEEWKIHVFYRRMTLKEYDNRRSAVNDLMVRVGASPVMPTGWVVLRKALRKKDPDLQIPDELRPLVYR